MTRVPDVGGTPHVVDAHAHVWDLDRVEYPWLTEETGLRRTFDERALRQHLEAAGIHEAVLVQAANSFAETAFLLQVAEESPVVTGVVGWVPLEDPDAAGAALSLVARNPPLVGVRHLNHDEPDPDWLLRDRVVESLALAADLGVPFDVVATRASHLRSIVRLAERLPRLRIVVDHLASPPAGQEAWNAWQADMATLAGNENVFAKLSGLTTLRLPGLVPAHALQRWVAAALDLFGPARLMYGGDWPVCLLAGDYDTQWSRLREVLGCLDEPDLRLVLGGTAHAFYGISRPAPLTRPEESS